MLCRRTTAEKRTILMKLITRTTVKSNVTFSLGTAVSLRLYRIVNKKPEYQTVVSNRRWNFKKVVCLKLYNWRQIILQALRVYLTETTTVLMCLHNFLVTSIGRICKKNRPNHWRHYEIARLIIFLLLLFNKQWCYNAVAARKYFFLWHVVQLQGFVLLQPIRRCQQHSEGKISWRKKDISNKNSLRIAGIPIDT